MINTNDVTKYAPGMFVWHPEYGFGKVVRILVERATSVYSDRLTPTFVAGPKVISYDILWETVNGNQNTWWEQNVLEIEAVVGTAEEVRQAYLARKSTRAYWTSEASGVSLVKKIAVEPFEEI